MRWFPSQADRWSNTLEGSRSSWQVGIDNQDQKLCCVEPKELQSNMLYILLQILYNVCRGIVYFSCQCKFVNSLNMFDSINRFKEVE